MYRSAGLAALAPGAGTRRPRSGHAEGAAGNETQERNARGASAAKERGPLWESPTLRERSSERAQLLGK